MKWKSTRKPWVIKQDLILDLNPLDDAVLGVLENKTKTTNIGSFMSAI